ncbi:MAG: IS1 family transposase [Ferruginibacter sp.]|nr:IS1 family transposase [Cytophagales bacterium]
MILEARTCHRCQSKNLILNGKNASGQQRYQCKDCGVTRVLGSVQKSKQVDLQQVVQTYQERNSFPSTARIFKVSHVTIQKWLKKSPIVSRFQNHYSDCSKRICFGVGRSFQLHFVKSQSNTNMDSVMSPK